MPNIPLHLQQKSLPERGIHGVWIAKSYITEGGKVQ